MSRCKTNYIEYAFATISGRDQEWVNMVGKNVLKKDLFSYLGSILQGREIDENVSHDMGAGLM